MNSENLDSESKPKQPLTITVHGQYNGYDVSVMFTSSLGGIPAAMWQIEQAGIIPRETPPQAAQDAPKSTEPTHAPDGSPLCPKHRAPMKKRTRHGETWHSHSMRDSSGNLHYCKGHMGADSPGWEL